MTLAEKIVGALKPDAIGTMRKHLIKVVEDVMKQEIEDHRQSLEPPDEPNTRTPQ